MRFYENPDWLAHVAAVVANPLEHTPRVAAADWLEDTHGDDPAAVFRARLIRYQCDTGGPPLRLTRYGPDVGERTPRELYDWEAAGEACGFDACRGKVFHDPFPEPWLNPTWDFWSVGGFPEVVCFAPWRFNRDNVAPVFLNAPVRTCTMSHVRPNRSHHQWAWSRGPENNFGVLDSRDFSSWDVKAHADVYLTNWHFGGYVATTIPGPVFQKVAILSPGGTGQFPTARDAVAAVLKAAWFVGRNWAGLPGKLIGVPDPDPEFVRVVCKLV